MQKVLKNLGLTSKEAELYIFLAKHEPLRSGETAIMESTKQSVLNDWKNISKIDLQSSLEKFTVVQGSKKIYSKILQMTKETKTQLSMVIPVSGLARADHFGIIEAMSNDSLKDKIKFRVLTELPDENLNTINSFYKRILKKGIDIKGRNPNLGMKLSPRMVLRDETEILLFIRPTAELPSNEQEDVCLWTNCKTLVQTFNAVFENLWSTSSNVYDRIAELEAGEITLSMSVFNVANISLKTYDEVINSAKKEIIMMTSSEGLVEAKKRIDLLKKASEKNVLVKIIAPITKENWQAAQELSQYFSIRHALIGHLEITVIDGKNLIQSKIQPPFDIKGERIPYFGTYFSNDREYVNKTKIMLDQIWRNEAVPLVSTIDSIMKDLPTGTRSSEVEHTLLRTNKPHRKLLLDVKSKRDVLLEKDVLKKIINAKKYPGKNWPKDIIRYYGSNGLAVIHPSLSFNLPDMTVWAMHLNKQSSFGAADAYWFFYGLKHRKEMHMCQWHSLGQSKTCRVC